MNKTIKYCLYAGVITLILNGCATITSGTVQNVSFDSGPQGASVYVNDKIVGKTPVVVPVSRSGSTTVRIEKEGYAPEEFAMTVGVNGMFWGNILIGGLLGSATDSSTGAINAYSPNAYFVELIKEGEVKPKKVEEKVKPKKEEEIMDF